MYSIYFWFDILLSFAIGGIWIAVTTVIAERLGSRIGGFVAGLPSTVVIAFLFIAISQSTAIASEATTAVPFSLAVVALFLVSFAYMSRSGFVIGIIGALLVWFALSAAVVFLNIGNYAYALLAYILILCLSYLLLERHMRLKSSKSARISHSSSQLLLRMLFSGAVIAFAVFMAKTGGPIYGGIFSVFPASFIPTLVIVYKSRGLEFARNITKSMLTAGPTVIVYVTAVRYLYPYSGLFAGTIVAFLLSICSAYVVYRFMTSRLS